MLWTRTPYRISFFGGGTDYPEWFEEHGGAVLTSSIDKYCHMFLRHLPPFFEHKHRIVWSLVELVKELEEIQHPVVRSVLKEHKVETGVEVHHIGDLPSRAGLGSSSAFTVGLLHALHALNRRPFDSASLAQEAIYVERVLLSETVGVQDQIQTAFGGINRIDIQPDGSFGVRPLALTAKRIAELEENLLLLFTGTVRHASQIAQEAVRAIPSHQGALRQMRRLVDQAESILTGHGDLSDFGRLLDETWRLKRGLASAISTAMIDVVYETALRNGAVGGKLLGAGGGGFVLLFAPPETHPRILRALDKLIHIPFTFEHQGTHLYSHDTEIQSPASGDVVPFVPTAPNVLEMMRASGTVGRLNGSS